MADIKIPFSDGANGPCGERGERGERGKRGHRGHDGETGPTGATGPTGSIGTTGSTGGTGPTGTTGFPPIIAAATVNVGGTFASQTGFASLTHPSTGQYNFQLTNPPVVQANTVVIGMIISGGIAGQITATLVAGGFNMFTYDPAGVLADRFFAVAVYDLT
jgi:hypothetical protein